MTILHAVMAPRPSVGVSGRQNDDDDNAATSGPAAGAGTAIHAAHAVHAVRGGPAAGAGTAIHAAHGGPVVVEIDVYDLFDACDSQTTGVYLSGDVDQEFLASRREEFDALVRGGLRVAVNGHVQRPFLTGLSRWRRVDYRGPADLALTRVSEHPVWRGVDPEALLYSTPPGTYSLAERAEVGVAGFYGRGYYLDLPEQATVVHRLGRIAGPIDAVFPLGAGEVLVHAGNDLLQFASADRGTAILRDNLLTWLEGR